MEEEREGGGGGGDGLKGQTDRRFERFDLFKRTSTSKRTTVECDVMCCDVIEVLYRNITSRIKVDSNFSTTIPYS